MVNIECKCGKTAVYFRANEGSHYCGSCLSGQVERNFLKEISRNPLTKDDVVAVGVSGGKDSMVLLHLMDKLAKKTRTRLIAITIDEGIEGYRDKSIDAVKVFVEKLGIGHRIVSFKNELDFSIDDMGKKTFLERHPSGKTCTYCGVFRRKLLNKAAREAGATRLAVGHNLDDEAQSVLMNVVRGDTVRMKRLGGQKGKEGLIPRIKPLKNVPEKEIVAYAIINNIPYFDGECPNSFNNVRRDVQTVVNDLEAKYPGTKNQIVKFYGKIRIEDKPGVIGRCVKCGEPSSKDVCRACELLEKAKNL